MVIGMVNYGKLENLVAVMVIMGLLLLVIVNKWRPIEGWHNASIHYIPFQFYMGLIVFTIVCGVIYIILYVKDKIGE